MASNQLFKLQVNPTFKDLAKRFIRADEQLFQDREKQADSLMSAHVAIMRDEAPKKTGEFARGIDGQTFKKGIFGLGYTISEPDPLGRWIRLGTKPHPIPKPHGSLPYPLAFFWAKKGANVVLWGVNHPGTKPNRYDERANKRIEPDMEKTTAKISTRYVTMIAKGRSI